MAQAEAEALSLIEGKVGQPKAAQYLIALKYLESLQSIANGQATKVFLPFEATGVLGAVGTVREMFGAQ